MHSVSTEDEQIMKVIREIISTGRKAEIELGRDGIKVLSVTKRREYPVQPK